MQENTEHQRLERSYSYSNTIIEDFEKFRNDIISKMNSSIPSRISTSPIKFKKIVGWNVHIVKVVLLMIQNLLEWKKIWP